MGLRGEAAALRLAAEAGATLTCSSGKRRWKAARGGAAGTTSRELGRGGLQNPERRQQVEYWSLGIYCREKGLWAESVAAHKKAVELSGGSALMRGWLGLALGQAGHTREARGVLADLRAAAGTVYVPPTCFAWTHLGLGEIDDMPFPWKAVL